MVARVLARTKASAERVLEHEAVRSEELAPPFQSAVMLAFTAAGSGPDAAAVWAADGAANDAGEEGSPVCADDFGVPAGRFTAHSGLSKEALCGRIAETGRN